MAEERKDAQVATEEKDTTGIMLLLIFLAAAGFGVGTNNSGIFVGVFCGLLVLLCALDKIIKDAAKIIAEAIRESEK